MHLLCSSPIPLTYSDDLSLYENVCKIINEIKNVNEEIAEILKEQSKTILEFNSVQEMIEYDNYAENNIVILNGYYENEGHGGFFYVRKRNDNDVENFGTIFFVSTNLTIERIYNEPITPFLFGAFGNRNVTENFNRMLSFSKSVFIPNGTYTVDYLYLQDNQSVIGETKENVRIISSGKTVYNDFIFGNKAKQEDYQLENLEIDGNGSNINGVVLFTNKAILKNLKVHDFKGVGISLTGGYTWGKHCEINDIILYDNEKGNLYYDSSTDTNFYGVFAYYNSDVPKPDYNIRNIAHGVRWFGCHLWGRCYKTVINEGFNACFTQCHLEGGDVKLYTENRIFFDGTIYETENVGGIGVQFGKNIVNSIIRGLFRDVKYAVDTQGFDENGNVFEITMISSLPDNAILKNPNQYSERSVWRCENSDWQSGQLQMKFINSCDGYTQDNYNNISREKITSTKNFYNDLGSFFAIHQPIEPTTSLIEVISGNGVATVRGYDYTLQDCDIAFATKGNGTVRLAPTANTNLGLFRPTVYLKDTMGNTIYVPIQDFIDDIDGNNTDKTVDDMIELHHIYRLWRLDYEHSIKLKFPISFYGSVIVTQTLTSPTLMKQNITALHDGRVYEAHRFITLAEKNTYGDWNINTGAQIRLEKVDVDFNTLLLSDTVWFIINPLSTTNAPDTLYVYTTVENISFIPYTNNITNIQVLTTWEDNNKVIKYMRTIRKNSETTTEWVKILDLSAFS